jgi:hypothetical protein
MTSTCISIQSLEHEMAETLTLHATRLSSSSGKHERLYCTTTDDTPPLQVVHSLMERRMRRVDQTTRILRERVFSRRLDRINAFRCKGLTRTAAIIENFIRDRRHSVFQSCPTVISQRRHLLAPIVRVLQFDPFSSLAS